MTIKSINVFNKNQFRADVRVARYVVGGVFFSLGVLSLAYVCGAYLKPDAKWQYQFIWGLMTFVYYGLTGIAGLGLILYALLSIWEFLVKIRDRYWIALIDPSELPGIYCVRANFYRLPRRKRRLKRGFWDRIFNEEKPNNMEDV